MSTFHNPVHEYYQSPVQSSPGDVLLYLFTVCERYFANSEVTGGELDISFFDSGGVVERLCSSGDRHAAMTRS